MKESALVCQGSRLLLETLKLAVEYTPTKVQKVVRFIFLNMTGHPELYLTVCENFRRSQQGLCV